ncbi:MAG: amidohydrolase family protein, partial [Pseudomonadota bacterium]
MIRTSLAALLLTLAATAHAQSLDVRAGRLIDPGSARVLTDQRIRITDGKIVSVTTWRDADGP